jgi:hypothetical protein
MTIVNDSSGNQNLTSITIPDVIKYGDVININVTTTDSSTPIVVSTSDSLIFSINSSNNEITVIKVGSATLTVTQGSESIITSSLTVEKKDLLVDVNSKSMVYGSNSPSFNSSFTGFVFNETSMGLSGNFLYVVTDVSSNVISSNNLPTSNVGTYTITVSMGSISSLKYNIIINNSTASLTITKKTLTINAINASMNYGDSVPALVSYNGFVNGDSSSTLIGDLSYSTVFSSSSNAGSNNFTISIGSLVSQNYNISIVISSAILTINVLTPVLSIANTTYVYGDRSYLTDVSSIYNSSTVSGTFELRLNNSTGTILTTSNYIPSGSNVLYVKFTPSSSNYLITSSTFNLTITKIGPILSYTPSTQSYNYGISLTSGNLNATSNVAGTFSYTYTLNSNTSVTGPALSTTKLNVGVYTLTATFVPTDTNIYDSSSSITFSSLTVNKIDLTVSISTNPVRFYYGLNVPQSISYSYSGFVNSETVSIFSGQSPDFQVSSNNPQTILITKANLAGSPVGTSYFINSTQGTLTSNNYNFVFGTVRNCYIDKANPTVTITVAQNLRTFDYLTPLTSDYFNGVATVKDVNNNDVSITGTFSFKDYYRNVSNIGVGYIFNAGSQYIQCFFTPTDSTKYNSVWANNIELTVNKITPTITYNIPSNLKTVNYGTTLVSSQLNAVVTYNGVNVSVGTISYKPNSTSSLINYTTSSYPAADLTKIYAIFDDSNYNSVSTFDTITVNKINATLNWIYPNLQNIAYGRPLSNYQLCAQTYNDPNNSAPGIINYKLSSNNASISLNQILDVGTYDFKAILVVTNPNYISETLMIQNTLRIVKNIPSVTWANPRDVVVGTVLSSIQLNANVSVSNAVTTYTPSSGTVMNSATTSQTGPIELNVLATYDNSNFLFDSISTKVKLNVNN